MSFFDSLKAMFSGKAKTQAATDDCCGQGHTDIKEKTSCCEGGDGGCCKIAPQSEVTDDCDCGHDHKAE
ncbi:MAG: hypothetical protein QG626_198 [Patescibacteria group bacterium]|nr:hypothetical protein [Patescibacteria group bacterium]